MSQRGSSALAAIVLSMGLAGPAWALRAGDPAPDFTLDTLSGKPVRLSSFKGKVILLDFWATWCPPCKDSLPHITKLQERFRDRGLVVLAINVKESADDVRAFIRSMDLKGLMILRDPSPKVVDQYQIRGMPSSFLLDRQGVIRYVHIGYTGETLAQYVEELRPLLGPGSSKAAEPTKGKKSP